MTNSDHMTEFKCQSSSQYEADVSQVRKKDQPAKRLNVGSE